MDKVNITNISDRLVGHWTGTKELYFTGPPNPDNVSDSQLTISPVALGKFLSFSYTWEFKGTSHEGFMLVGNGNAERITTAAWVDSFHMSDKIMYCEGTVDGQRRINVLGSYEAPPGPDWSWRIKVIPGNDSLQIIMFNISPDGEEVLAVRASYAGAED